MIRFQCPGCSTPFNTTDDKAGKSAKCPHCDATFVIPTVEAAAVASDEQSFEVVVESDADDSASMQIEIEPCPSCGARVAVAAEHLNSNVDCPFCATTFIAKAVERESTPTRALRRVRRDDDDATNEDDAERPRRTRRTRPVRRRSQYTKPGNVTAVGVMLLVGGIYGLIYVFGVVLGSFFVCCLWPFSYLMGIWSIFAIIRGVSILGDNDTQPAPTTLLILQILCVLNLDFINCILGIVGFVLLNDPPTRAYFDGRRPEE